jgi:predicted signal transduction protein with EAL and GGDEF domain
MASSSLPPIPLAVMRAGEGTLLSSGLDRVFTLETLLYVVGTAFIVLMMAKERSESLYKAAAESDPLTGLLNRRGFMERAESLIGRQPRGNSRVSLLMFDLDHFKLINDRLDMRSETRVARLLGNHPIHDARW